MEKLEWTKVYYNDLETNIEVTRCGRVRKVKVDWYGNGKGQYRIKLGEVDFSKLNLNHGYKQIGTQIKSLKPKCLQIHQLIAMTFLNHKPNKFNVVVDHIDSNKLNNHVDNLRIITHRKNMSKERTQKRNLPLGVYFWGKSNKYYSKIHINKKSIFLGYYNTIEEASNIYQSKLKTLCV